MESQGNPIYEARNLLEYRDIDTTLTQFLEHFQQKYLYSIPFDIIINKQLLLKHITDVYRSKGTTECYKLLFKLIYNEDITVYLPGEDILRASDGTWVQPKYIEINDNGNLDAFIGKRIIGVTSGTSAIVENIVKNYITNSVVCNFSISNVQPNGGTFDQGEKLIIENENDSVSIATAPFVLGSLDSLNIINGGQNFQVGDILKIAHYDPLNNKQLSFGVNGKVKVTNVSYGYGSLNFDIINGGFGYTQNAHVFLYNGDGDTVGSGAAFSLNNLSYVRNITYNTDILCDYANTILNAASYNFPANSSGNSQSSIGSLLSTATDSFGTIASLTNIRTGNNYIRTPFIFVRSTLLSKPLNGTVNINVASNTIIGTNTSFTKYFVNNDVIALQSNSITIDYKIIRSVNSDTNLTLYGPPTYANNIGVFRAAPVILPANFIETSNIMSTSDGSINGENEYIFTNPLTGNNIVTSVVALSSGKGYIDNEVVRAYRYNSLSTPIIIDGGLNYSNNDKLIFTSSGFDTTANGYITTDSNGKVTSVILNYNGSGFIDIPKVGISTNTGNGAILKTTINEYDNTIYIEGHVVKKGVGRDVGYWTTTRGFLNSDKYIQDSYFYQDYSYQIKTSLTLDKYKNILYNAFHPSGSELFGEYNQTIVENSYMTLTNETTNAIHVSTYTLLADTTLYTSDNSNLYINSLLEIWN
jgi:hypothetical protein